MNPDDSLINKTYRADKIINKTYILILICDPFAVAELPVGRL